MKEPDIWIRYKSNFPRHLLGVTRYLQTETMRLLAEDYGHTELRLNFEPYMALVGDGCSSLSELARALGITKQAAAPTLSDLIRLGYIDRSDCQRDGRAKTLVITAAGQQMLDDGMRAYRKVEQQFLTSVSQQQLESAQAILLELCLALQLLPSGKGQGAGRRESMGSLLSRLSDYFNYRLMQLTGEQGHHNLKLSFAHVLSLLRPNGTRIQDIVRIRCLSKQAVGAIAKELEQLGYICRKADPESPRQQRLFWTEQGLSLLRHSARSVELLEAELEQHVSPGRLQVLKTCMADLYEGLALAKVEFGELFDIELETRATALLKELGPERARTLGKILVG